MKRQYNVHIGMSKYDVRNDEERKTMLNCVICDDEATAREKLLSFISRFSEETGEQVNAVCRASGDELLSDYPADVEVILLDIQMQGLDGIETARRIRAFDQNVCIIFITSMQQMAIEGYKVRALGFLAKPVEYPEFRNELSEVVRRRKSQRKRSIVLKSNGELHKLAVDDIYYAEVKNHNVAVYTTIGVNEFYLPLREVEAELSGCGFFCPHASFLVNQRYIAKIGKESLTLTDGSIIPISKHRKKAFLTELTNYIGNQI